MEYLKEKHVNKRIRLRMIADKLFKWMSLLATLFCIVILAILLYRVFSDGISSLNMSFLMNKLSTMPEKAGILGAILGSLWLMAVVAPVTMFFGVCTAIYIELYAKESKIQSFIKMNIANLAGVPSIVYGILGLTIFVRTMGLGNIVLAGGLTLSLLILPITIVATQESLRSVPSHLSEGAYGMGATKWQTIRTIILPAALPGILTGVILSISRAIGETAPLVVIGIPALLIPLPGSIFDKFTVLPMQIYYWTVDSVLVEEYASLAAGTIIVLLVVLLLCNLTAIMIRRKFSQTYH
ncbi:MAG TPA: phosphate ABC transporter permease PstA [Pseudogracilibacillus sp.]|nr:phosphate ABC transporter permease PstA [Pseudogracilibacillus sp.]